MAVSFCFLIEFGRSGINANSKYHVGKWIYATLITITLSGAYYGWTGIDITVHYVLGVSGSIWTALAFLTRAKHLKDCPKLPFKICGTIFGIYAASCIAAIPNIQFYPVSAINQDSFLQTTGFPIQIAQGILALTASVFIWKYYISSYLFFEIDNAEYMSRLASNTVLSVLLVIILGWQITEITTHYTDSIFRRSLLAKTTTASVLIDTNDLASLTGSPGDLDNPAYRRIQRKLHSVKLANPDSRYVYIMKYINGKVIFLADAASESAPGYSAPGDVYNEANNDLIDALTKGKACVSGPIKDTWGTWISGFSAIRNENNQILGIVGIDIAADQWMHMLIIHRFFCIIAILLICVITITYYIIIQRTSESASRISRSERRYRGLVEVSPNWISLVGIDGRIITINQTGLNIMGWNSEDIIGKNIFEVKQNYNCLSIYDNIKQSLSGEKSDFNLVLSHSNGSPVDLHVTVNPITDIDGIINHLVWIADDITERNRVESALLESEKRYRLMADSATDIIWISNLDLIFTFISPSATRMLGYTMDEISKISLFDIISQECYDKINELINLDITGAGNSSISSFVCEARCKDGSSIWIETEASIIYDLNNRPINITGVTRNITDRKIADKALQESRDALSTLMNNIPGMVYRCINDEYWTFTFTSDGCYNLTGYPSENLLMNKELSFANIIHPDDREYVRESVNSALETNSTFQLTYRIITASGEIKWINDQGYIVMPSEISDNIILEGLIMDITDRKNTEEALRTSETNYRTIFDTANDAIFVFNTNTGKVIDVNQRMTEIFGYSREEALGLSLKDLSAPGYNNAKDLRIISSVNDSKLFEWVTRKKTGEILWVEVNLKHVSIGGRDCILAIVRDIMERKQAETILRMQISAINAATDQIMITDADGNILYVNPAFENETGYSHTEVVGKNLVFVKSGYHQDKLRDGLTSSIRTGNTWHEEAIIRRKNGTLYAEDITVTPVRNDAGVVEYFIAINRNITDKKVYEQKLDHLAHHDPLTGLPNRLLLSDRLLQRLAQAHRKGQMLAIMFLDLDHFKDINDTKGHNEGDKILRAVAKRLTSCLREVDTVARMGGDEFTIIVSDITRPEDASTVAKKIINNLSKPFAINGDEVLISTSIGISIFPTDGIDSETMLKNADIAMYRAKDSGRNNYQFYTEELNTAVTKRIMLENSMKDALERNEFVVYYQPRIDIRSGEIIGIEALVRWQHPELGLLAPAQFMPLAEETGLIIPLSKWILDTACSKAKSLQESYIPMIQLAINISARQFEEPQFKNSIITALEKSRLNPNTLDLELTENILLREPISSELILNDLRSIGVQITIDDFGSAQSSLNRLKHFPVDTIKIDKSYIQEITSKSDDTDIAEAMITMAHSLNLQVVAKGVETLEQMRILRSLKCDGLQGYYISQPLPAVELEELIRESKTRNTSYASLSDD
ncbi:MAG: bifunctional diguanylate cyclase/phosphodiesterase [Armatimonadota bacterium]